MTLKQKYLAGLFALSCLAGVFTYRYLTPAVGTERPPTIPEFQLKDTDGRDVSLSDYRDRKAVAVVFVGTECMLANLYLLRLAEMQREYGPDGVQVLAVNSNPQDTPDAIARHARKRDLPFPVLIDSDQKVADLFGANRTPSAYLLDGKGVVRYRGRIDDRFSVGADRGEATRHDLWEAIEDVLANRPVRVPVTEVAGCFIPRVKLPAPKEEITYSRHVAAILQKYCQDCHRPGQVAPFSLLKYEQAVNWSDTIKEVVSNGRMPPWHADPKHGSFANDRSLPTAERDQLLAWIDNGMPKGDDADLPAPRTFPKGPELSNADVVLTMPETFTVPAVAPKGGIPYQHFVLPTNFTEDVWLAAVEARPGNRAVVHHMIAYVGDAPMRSGIATGDRDVVVGWVPGAKATKYPPILGKRIPKGAKLVLEMHYTANGTEQTDRSSVALVFAKQPPKHEARSRFVLSNDFTIPASAANHRVGAATVFEKNAVLLSVTPHMHLRGKSFEAQVVYPDSRREVLLSVPRYDFNWQHTYVLSKPLPVPAGTRIECVGHFDNSAGNPNNPDPGSAVRWGDQSWEEMMLGVVGYFYADPA